MLSSRKVVNEARSVCNVESPRKEWINAIILGVPIIGAIHEAKLVAHLLALLVCVP